MRTEFVRARRKSKTFPNIPNLSEFVTEVGGERPSLIAVIDQLATFLMPHAATARTFAQQDRQDG